MNDYPIVEIEWTDHAGDNNDFHDIDKAKDWTLVPFRHVGYLIAEHKDRYVIAFGVSGIDRGKCSGLMILAKVQVTSIIHLKENKTE